MFKFGKYVRKPGPYSAYRDARPVTASVEKASSLQKYKKATRVQSDYMSGNMHPGGGGGDSFNAGQQAGQGMGGYGTDHYNPVFDQLEEGTILEDWIPRDGAGLDMLMKRIYLRDPTLGPGIDLIRSLPWSDFTLEGIDDKSVLKVYQDCVEALNPMILMPDLTGDFLVLGKTCSSLIFDERRGIFAGIIPHDPDFLRIKPQPIYGYDPVLDLKLSPGFRRFLLSDDPREADVRKILPQAFIDAARSQQGFLPLDPVSTVYIGRKMASYDSMGTSLLTRTLYFWGIEKALLNATLASTRRRVRSFAHIKAGIDGIWEPTAEEIDALAGMILQANEDPVGGIVATRTGVDISEPLGGGSDFYKWSDEIELFAKYKMQAIGISDALLNGDSTYNNAEQARSVFVENLANMRARIAGKFFMDKMFPTIARIHGFVKRTQAELNHRIRTTSVDSAYQRYMTVDRHLPVWAKMSTVTSQRLTDRKTKQLSPSELMIPNIQWSKQLKPLQDEKALEILEKLKQNEQPTTIRQWAQAAGYDPDTVVQEAKKNAETMKQLADIEAASQAAMPAEGGEGGEESADQEVTEFDDALDETGGGEEPLGPPEGAEPLKPIPEFPPDMGGGMGSGGEGNIPEAPAGFPAGEEPEAVHQSLYKEAEAMGKKHARKLTDIAIWHNNKCMGLTVRDAELLMATLSKEYSPKIYSDPAELRAVLQQKLGRDRAEVMAYVLNRMGYTRFAIDRKVAEKILGSARDSLGRVPGGLINENGARKLKQYEVEYHKLTASVRRKVSIQSEGLARKMPVNKLGTKLYSGVMKDK